LAGLIRRHFGIHNPIFSYSAAELSGKATAGMRPDASISAGTDALLADQNHRGGLERERFLAYNRKLHSPRTSSRGSRNGNQSS